MNRHHATIVVEPPLAEFAGLVEKGRALHAYDEFASELGKYLGTTVDIVELPLCDALSRSTGMLLLDSGNVAQSIGNCGGDSHVARRIVLMQANRTNVLETLERYRFAGAVEANRYFQWKHHRDQETGTQLYGLKSVAQRMGAACSPIPFSSASYCLFDEPKQPNLPALLASYLNAYKDIAETGA
jgi:hypothetical protein